MALAVADRVKETSTTTGTGTLTLGGAATGFQTFSSGIGNGNTCYYAISIGSDWEVGLGTVGAGTLSRDTILASSNAGSAVSFGAGAKDVFATYPAGKAVYKDASGNVVGLAIGTDIQAYDGDLAAIAALAGTTGLLKKTAANTWSLDTTAYGTGSVTTVSVASANGFAGSVANAGTTPAITVSTSVSGILKGNGTAVSAATAGTDYLAPPAGTSILKANSGGALANAVAGTDYVTPSGTETLSGKTLVDPTITGTIIEDIYTITDGAAFEIDPGNGSIQLITLGASRTPKATNFANGEAVTLMVDDGTAYTLTWTDATFGGSGVVWKTDSGSAPTLNTSGYTAIVLWKVGGQVYGARVGNA